MVDGIFTQQQQQQQNLSSLLWMLFTFDNFIRALCGAIGSATSITILYPLEIIRTRLQINDPKLSKISSTIQIMWYMYSNEGLKSLYKGYTSLVLALGTTNFVFFYTFHALRHTHTHSHTHTLNSDATTAQMDLFFSAIAGIVTVMITNPLWVVNTRLKLQQQSSSTNSSSNKGESKLRRYYYRGIIDCFKCIIEDEGIIELWSGTTSSILLVTNPMIQFVTYEYLKRITTTSSSQQQQQQQHGDDTTTTTTITTALLYVFYNQIIPHHLHPLINGSISKIIATITTYPLQLLQTLRRAGMLKDNNNSNKNNSSTNNNDDDAMDDNTSTAETATTTMTYSSSSASSSSSLSLSNHDDTVDQQQQQQRRRRRKQEELPKEKQPKEQVTTSSTKTKEPVLRRRHSLMKLYDQGTVVVKTHGLQGLFRGLESKLLQTGLNAGLMFLIYEELSTFIFYLAGIDK